MNINELISFAEAYACMGKSVRSQLEDFMNGKLDGLNVNAIDMCADLIKECSGLDRVDGAQELLDELDACLLRENF